MLKRITGQDFEYDVQKWKDWIRRNSTSVPGAEGDESLLE
jgi:hypothetical protein